MTQKLKL